MMDRIAVVIIGRGVVRVEVAVRRSPVVVAVRFVDVCGRDGRSGSQRGQQREQGNAASNGPQGPVIISAVGGARQICGAAAGAGPATRRDEA